MTRYGSGLPPIDGHNQAPESTIIDSIMKLKVSENTTHDNVVHAADHDDAISSDDDDDDYDDGIRIIMPSSTPTIIMPASTYTQKELSSIDALSSSSRYGDDRLEREVDELVLASLLPKTRQLITIYYKGRYLMIPPDKLISSQLASLVWGYSLPYAKQVFADWSILANQMTVGKTYADGLPVAGSTIAIFGAKYVHTNAQNKSFRTKTTSLVNDTELLRTSNIMKVQHYHDFAVLILRDGHLVDYAIHKVCSNVALCIQQYAPTRVYYNAYRGDPLDVFMRYPAQPFYGATISQLHPRPVKLSHELCTLPLCKRADPFCALCMTLHYLWDLIMSKPAPFVRTPQQNYRPFQPAMQPEQIVSRTTQSERPSNRTAHPERPSNRKVSRTSERTSNRTAHSERSSNRTAHSERSSTRAVQPERPSTRAVQPERPSTRAVQPERPSIRAIRLEQTLPRTMRSERLDQTPPRTMRSERLEQTPPRTMRSECLEQTPPRTLNTNRFIDQQNAHGFINEQNTHETREQNTQVVATTIRSRPHYSPVTNRRRSTKYHHQRRPHSISWAGVRSRALFSHNSREKRRRQAVYFMRLRSTSPIHPVVQLQSCVVPVPAVATIDRRRRRPPHKREHNDEDVHHRQARRDNERRHTRTRDDDDTDQRRECVKRRLDF